MVAAKEKTVRFKSGSNIEPMVNKPAHPTAATTTPTVVNRISSYDFTARKFSKPPIGTSEKIHLIVHVESTTKPRKYTGENVVHLRRLHWAPEMSLYRGYFVPSGVDPTGMIRCTATCRGVSHYVDRPHINPLDGMEIQVPQPVYVTKKVTFTTGGMNVNPCPKGWDLVDIDCPDNPDDLFDQLGEQCDSHPRCKDCSPAKLKKLLEALKKAAAGNKPVAGTTDPCERWCQGFEGTKADWMDNDCIASVNFGHHAFYVSSPLVWYAGHVVVKITLCDGSIIYVDNGTVGGDDNIGLPSESPTWLGPAWTHGHRCPNNWEYVCPHR